MTSPIYPPQGGSSEVWRIKLSPEIKWLLAQFSRGGRCAHSPYVFQSCCILFDIINVDQGVLRSTQTHSPPKGNISLNNTDVINADFHTCAMCNIACEGTQLSTGFYLNGFVWCKSVQCVHAGVCICVYTVCTWSQSKRDHCQGVYSVLLPQSVRNRLRCNILTTHVASYPNAGWKWEHRVVLQCTCTLYTFRQFGWESESLRKWKRFHMSELR